MDNQLVIEDPDNWESASVVQHIDDKSWQLDNSDDEDDPNSGTSETPKLSDVDVYQIPEPTTDYV